MEDYFYIIIITTILAFIFKFMDSSFGAGYGTILTPLFMLLGYHPFQIIPSILISESIAGLTAAFFHNKVHNVKFSSINAKDTKIAIILTIFSIIGVTSSAFLAVNLPTKILKITIGILIILIGLIVLTTLKFKPNFSWKKIIFIGALASTVKGISGGGYGPIIMGGEIISGIKEKHAIGIAMFAEGITCIFGAIVYLLTKSADLILLPGLIIGSTLASPFAAKFIHNTHTHNIKILITIVIIFLGIFNIIQNII